MIYSVTINNKAIADSGLPVSLQTAYLIGGIIQMTTNWRGMAKLEHDGRVFFWLDYSKVLDELPLLDMKPDSLYRALKSIASEGFLIAHPDNKAMRKPFYAISEKCYFLFGPDVGKKSEHSEKNPTANNSLGKKSDSSEKNPKNIGKKSERTSEKNPLNNSTIDNNSTKDNSSSEEEGQAEKNQNEKNADDAEWVEVVVEEAAQPDPWGWRDAEAAREPQPKKEAPTFDISASAKSKKALAALEARLEEVSQQIDRDGLVTSPYRTDAKRFLNGLLMNYAQGLQMFFQKPQGAGFDSEDLFAAIGDFYAMKVQKIMAGNVQMIRHKPEPMALCSLLTQAASRQYPIEFWVSRVVKAIQGNAEWALPFGVESYWDAEYTQWARPAKAAQTTGTGRQAPQEKPMSRSQESYMRTKQILTDNLRDEFLRGMTAKIKAGNFRAVDYVANPKLYESICQSLGIPCPFDEKTIKEVGDDYI